jgi:outer membrane receptor for ferrienterochelin and colicins
LIIEHNHPNRIRSTFKGSVSSFDRDITTNTHFFRGNQTAYFTEASVYIPAEKIDWVGGINVLGDRFQPDLKTDPIQIEAFHNQTIGAFVQATAHLPHNSLLEAGLRTDHHVDYGTFVLPRLAFFHRFSDAWATRLGFGMGYKTPNALAPQNVEYDIEKILPIEDGTKAETSYGFNAEVNYKITWGEDNSLFINQALFLTRLQNPVVAMMLPDEMVAFANASKPVISKGSDTYIQADLNGWELYAGYTFTIAERTYMPQNNFVPLTPKHRFAFTLVKGIEDAWRLGLEGSYNGKQHRDADSNTPGYLFAAAMLERKFGSHVSLVLNGENLFDYRQSKYEALFTGSITDPKFKPLWAPIDGRVLNLSLRLKL